MKSLKVIGLLGVLAVVAVAGAEVADDIKPNLGGWWRTFTTRTEGAEAGVVDLVMVGDSITQGWVDQVGRGVLKARFGDIKVVSLGVSGDNVENQLGTTMWGGLDGYKAKVVQVMIGTNNSGRNRPARTAEGIRRLLGVIRAKQPQAKVILIPILPRGKAGDRCRAENEQVNAIIRGYADGKDVIWKDFSAKWVDASGNCTTNLMYDLLHPNANGYEMWAKEVRPLIDRLRAEVGDITFAGIPCVADRPVAPKTPAKVTERAEVLFIGDDVHDIHRDVMHRDPWTPEYYRDYKADLWNFNEPTEVLHGRLVDGNRPYGLYVIGAGRANVRLRDGAHEPPIDTYVGIKAMVQKIVADDPKARVLVLPPRTLPSDTPEQAERLQAVAHMLGFLPREVARVVTLPRDARAVKATIGCMIPNGAKTPPAAVGESDRQTSCARETSDWNDGWEFSRDGKTGFAPIAVPHDWAIAGPFDVEKGDPGTGKLPWKGVGYYRKNLVLDAVPKGRRVFLAFDGVMCDGTVFVNNQPCAHRTYGYLGMTADATPYLFAGTNTVIVRADTTKLQSRWYPGAGLYRRVRKIETDDIHLTPEGVYISTPAVSAEKATVLARVGVTNSRLMDERPFVVVEVFSPDGTSVGRSSRYPIRLSGGETGEVALSVEVAKPQLWRMEDDAKLYTTVVTVESEDGCAKDAVSIRTGFRTFRFDAEKGFFLNGEHVQLKGVCLHSDLGILGMAFNRSAMRRQLRILKDMGVNAIRTSHNPPAPELLDLCDEMGLFVWDECFDKWNETCGRGDEPLDGFVEANLRDFVRRDRNHPCVFIWSIGNEIASGGGCPPGQEMWSMPLSLGTTPERCTRFRQAVLAEDGEGGRPVGIGSCFTNAVHRGDYANLDITGWNYSEKYKPMKAAYPGKPVIYSESASAFSEYGYYAERLPTNKIDYAFADLRIDSYDRNSADWSDIPDCEFERMERDAYVCGEFVWTGMDYLGEPSPYAWRNSYGHEIAHRDLARSSYFGIFDLLGFPKDRAYLYRSYWNTRAFTLHIVPDHWTFPKRVGRTMPVYVYTSADEAELFVNGVSQGRRRKDPKATMANGYYAGLPRYRLMWDVVYRPGEVKVLAYGKDGKVLGAEILRTATEAASVVLTPESATLPDDPEELVFVKVTLADAKGTPIPGDCRRIGFKIDGPGEIVSVGNGNPRGFDSFKETSSHPLDNGRAGLVVRRTGQGKVALTASAEGLASAVVNW